MLKLKVFRTPIGFHDAYVAAPSQKAALEAWGADANLFARGVAEQVTDPALTKEPLARPGEVIRKLRGGLDDHLGALPADRPAPRKKAKPPRPRPSRSALDAAEAAIAALDKEHAEQFAELKHRHKAERDTLDKARLKADRAYQAALKRWQG